MRPLGLINGKKFEATGRIAKRHCPVNGRRRFEPWDEGSHASAVAAIKGVEPSSQGLAGGCVRNTHLGACASDAESKDKSKPVEHGTDDVFPRLSCCVVSQGLTPQSSSNSNTFSGDELRLSQRSALPRARQSGAAALPSRA